MITDLGGGGTPMCRSALLLISAALLTGGCSAPGTVQFVSLHETEIDPPGTNVTRFSAQECYWWTDGAGNLNIAMQCRQNHVLLGKYGLVELGLWWRLDKPPAGSGRNYEVGRRRASAAFFSAVQSLRLSSDKGIVGVTVRDDGTMTGSFRVFMTPRPQLTVFSLMPQKPGQFLCFGKFRAVEDAERGKAIRRFCITGSRATPSLSLPTTQPTSNTSTTQRGG